jgi:hypothetical protein
MFRLAGAFPGISFACYYFTSHYALAGACLFMKKLKLSKFRIASDRKACTAFCLLKDFGLTFADYNKLDQELSSDFVGCLIPKM